MLITIKTYSTEAEAFLDLSYLESFNIKAFIFNANASTIYPIFNSTIGGIELKVEEEFYQKAFDLLNK